MTVDPTEQTVKSADGTDLMVYKWLPSKKSKAQLVVVHGYLEHGMRYREFAQALAEEHQIAVSVYDFRGHGKSSGPRGYVSKWEDYHADLEAVLGTLSDDGTPKFVLGHSNGGLVSLDYFFKKGDELKGKINGLLITSPWLGPAAKLPYIKVLLSKFLGNIAPRLSLPVREDEVSGKVLTHDEEKVKEHDEDELNLTNFTLGWAYQSLLAQTRVTNNCKALSVPLMFAYAELDQVADHNLNKKFVQMLAVEDKTVLERKGCFHEVLNETDRKELYGIFAEWILKRV